MLSLEGTLCKRKIFRSVSFGLAKKFFVNVPFSPAVP